jgi:hypothetical protein
LTGALGGCAAGIKGRADSPAYLATSSNSYFQPEIATATKEAEGFKKEWLALRTNGGVEAKLRMTRNDYAYTMLRAYDLALQDYARSLSVEGRGGSFALTLATLGLTSTATIISNSVTQSILSAAATGLLGAQEGFSKDVLLEKTVDVLLVQMTTKHLQARQVVIDRLNRYDAMAYPITAVDLDLVTLSRVTSFEVALNEVGEAAATDLRGANAIAKNSSFAFRQDAATMSLRDLICPNEACSPPNTAALAAVRRCLTAAGVRSDTRLVDLVTDALPDATRRQVAQCAASGG